MKEIERVQIESIGVPTHVLLTCEYHLRETERYRRRWGCQLLANETELDRYETRVDGSFEDAQRLWGFIDCVRIEHGFYPETAFLVREYGGVLIIGDVLSGGRGDQGIPSGNLGIAFPEFLSDLSATRDSLANLLRLDFQVLCFGHGVSIVESAKDVLKSYLEDDREWKRLERLRDERGHRTAR